MTNLRKHLQHFFNRASRKHRRQRRLVKLPHDYHQRQGNILEAIAEIVFAGIVFKGAINLLDGWDSSLWCSGWLLSLSSIARFPLDYFPEFYQNLPLTLFHRRL